MGRTTQKDKSERDRARTAGENYLMSSLDESFVLDSLNLEVNLQSEAVQFGRMSQSDGGVDLSVGSALITSLSGHKLEGAQKTRWKRG